MEPCSINLLWGFLRLYHSAIFSQNLGIRIGVENIKNFLGYVRSIGITPPHRFPRDRLGFHLPRPLPPLPFRFANPFIAVSPFKRLGLGIV